MSTRRVKDGQRRTQNGWASAMEFDGLRGLNGTAVALKAELLDDPRAKSLLYFLQGRSLQIGAKGIARELREMFPERIASPTMLKIGCKPGKRLTPKDRDAIFYELQPDECISMARWNSLKVDGEKLEECKSSADDFVKQCHERAESGLGKIIERLCCDMSLAVTVDSKESEIYRRKALEVLEGTKAEWLLGLNTDIASVPYFDDLLGALFEYQRRCTAQVRENFVETSIGAIVFEALDYALETGRTALIEGNSGVGKTTALEAWCEIHGDKFRLVKLKGITTRTGFFRECARALGLEGTAGKMQMLIEQFLKRSKIGLAIDEGQYLFPPGNRVDAPPLLINWLNTACYNERVPYAISATSEFRKRRAIIEKNTTWDSFQLKRRLRRDFELPQQPTENDLYAVASKLMPGQSQSAIDYVVGYAQRSLGFFQAITDSVDDARIIARRDGRDKITFADLKAAVCDWRAPSDKALQRVFEAPKARRSGRPGNAEIEIDSPENSAADNEHLNRDLSPVKRQEISLVQSS